MKLGLIAIGVLMIGTVAAWAIEQKTNSYNLHYKVTVSIETPEGIKTGSAVREISNSVPTIDWPDVGNPGNVKGEAVVVDLGDRGQVFALIDDKEDNRFYNAFPVPGEKIGNGGSSPEGIAYYHTLKPGAKGTLNPKLFPGLPRLVTFINSDDPKSLASVMYWDRNWSHDDGTYYMQDDKFEELFGKDVKFKEMTYEITRDPVTWGKVDNFFPNNYEEEIVHKWRELPIQIRQALYELTRFKYGESK